jgi:hypothetical protein
MNETGMVIKDLDLDQWDRLMDLALFPQRQRRVFLLHEGGKPRRLYDTEAGELPLPAWGVDDAQAAADRLRQEQPGAYSAQVIDPESLRKAMSRAQATVKPGAESILDYLEREDELRWSAPGCARSPATGFLWHGLPVTRVRRFAEKMLPPSCTFVLAVFDRDELWLCLLVQFEQGRAVDLRTSAALDPADLKDVVGRDQHPFLLATVANAFRRPAFGWFVEREAFEAYMTAPTVEAKDEVFQRTLMQGRATFDFNILIDRGITPLSPLDPGSSAVAGAARDANPRTRVPDPDDPGPSAL